MEQHMGTATSAAKHVSAAIMCLGLVTRELSGLFLTAE